MTVAELDERMSAVELEGWRIRLNLEVEDQQEAALDAQLSQGVGNTMSRRGL